MNAQNTPMKIKVWGRPTSICTQRVLWCLDEAQLAYDLVLTSGTMGEQGHISTGARPYGGVDTAAYLQMNPHGRIPTIADGGFHLWESNAILMYLALKYAPRLYSGDVGEFAQASAWMSWSNQYLDPPLTDLVLNLVRLPESERKDSVVRRWNESMADSVQILDGHLASRAYVAGDAPSIAEFSIAPGIHRWLLFDLPRPSLPHLEAWHARLNERPAFQKLIQPKAYHLSG